MPQVRRGAGPPTPRGPPGRRAEIRGTWGQHLRNVTTKSKRLLTAKFPPAELIVGFHIFLTD